MKRYKIICGQCEGERVVEIHPSPMGQRIDWLEHLAQGQETTVVSARYRLDGQWGFQCICGANDLMTRQERENFTNPAAPSPQEINEIVSNLHVDAPLFRMVEA